MNIRLSFKYVNEFRDRHRRIRRYFRAPGRPAVRLPDGPLSSPEFLDAYKAAMTELEPRPIGADSTLPGTVKAAVASYLQSNHFGVLAKSTRDMRRRELDRFCEDHGGKPIARLEPQHIARIMSGRKPFAAHNLLKTLRGLMEFAVATGLVKTDPTASLKRPKAKAGSIHDWTEEEIAQYQARWPVGTMARLALAAPLYTAQRLSDVWRMGTQDIHHTATGFKLFVRQQKTGKELWLPILPQFAEVIAATIPGCEHLIERSGNVVMLPRRFLLNDWGRPFASADALSNKFRDWCNAADLRHCSMHGLRSGACRRLAEAGCTAPEVAAMSGHISLPMVQHYIRGADQKRLAEQAAAKLLA
jgi:integrase